MTVEQKLLKPAEPQVTRKGFAGRQILVSGLHDIRSELGDAQNKILSAHIVKETVLAIVQALRVKNAYEGKIIDEAKAIISARGQATPVRKSSHDLSSIEGVVGAAVEALGVEAEVSLQKRGTGSSGAYSIFIVKSGSSSDKVMVKDAVMSEAEPVTAAQNLLRLQGVGKDNTPKPVSANRRRAADEVGLEREDLESRKVAFHGSEGRMDNHFTYLEESMESSICLGTGLKGKELLAALDKRILQLHGAYQRRMSSQVAEAVCAQESEGRGTDKIPDPETRKVAMTLQALADKYNETLVPEEYLGAVKRLRESQEYYEFSRNETEGVLSIEEFAEYRQAFEDIDHPAHKMARAIVKGMTEGKRELTDDEKVMLRDSIVLHSQGMASVDPKVLEVLTETYGMVTNEDVSAWDETKRSKNYFKMAYTVRKAVLGLASCMKVISNEEAREESYEI
ncbi:MAG TPA: hypothetical protein VLD37_00190 [Candidatus Bilamarchaeum sp.]|nr:hypothetical protein [Candidatus Bilamarchaeum sp.]